MKKNLTTSFLAGLAAGVAIMAITNKVKSTDGVALKTKPPRKDAATKDHRYWDLTK